MAYSTQGPALPPAPSRRRRARWSTRVALVAVLVAGLSLVYATLLFGRGLAAPPRQPAPPASADAGLGPGSAEAQSQLAGQYGQDLYLTDHSFGLDPAYGSANPSAAVQVWMASLQRSRPTAERTAAVAALTQSPPSVVPTLLAALSSADPGVREGAVQVLGQRRDPEAKDTFFFVSFDSDPGVRAAAATALGDVGSPFALPRLQWLETVEHDPNVRLAARLAEGQVYGKVAYTLGVQADGLRVLAVASSDGSVYGATAADLYAPRGTPEWQLVGPVPDVPTALAATGDSGQDLYLGTAAQGIFRSPDGGVTWQAIDAGLPNSAGFAVTAITVDPDDGRQVYVTLAAQGDPLSPLLPYGLYTSQDAGDRWQPLVKWNVDDITTRLVIDPSQVLYGLTAAGSWQYPLSGSTTSPAP